MATRVPRITQNDGNEAAWTTATRPTHPSHGTAGLNTTTGAWEVYDSNLQHWYTFSWSTSYI